MTFEGQGDTLTTSLYGVYISLVLSLSLGTIFDHFLLMLFDLQSFVAYKYIGGKIPLPGKRLTKNFPD